MLMISAENDIAQGKLTSANEKISLKKKKLFDKKNNIRLKFIQGQIYLQTKQYNQAYKCFGYVYRHASDYQMQFTAKLNQSLCFESGDNRSIKAINDLENMLDKDVNIEYREQKSDNCVQKMGTECEQFQK